MKNQRQRVIAIDYFRGLAILVVVINHAAAFSLPFAYLTGASRLWASAASTLLIISGLTFGIVRGVQVMENFKLVLIKTWHRVAYIYGLYVAATLASLALALTFLSHNLPTNIYPDGVPTQHIFHVLFGIFTLSYSFGWASFLTYFIVFLALAPFLAYALNTRRWFIVPIVSVGLYAFTASRHNVSGVEWFAIWQLYFVIGLTIARFRHQISGSYFGLKKSAQNVLSITIVSAAALVMALSALIEFNFYPVIHKFTESGILPQKLQSGYVYLKAHQAGFDNLLMQERSAILRPLVALLVFSAVYIIYQKYKEPVLKYSGNFIIGLGKDTLWIFAAQGLAIPALAVLPIPRNLAYNLMLTIALIGLMWLVTKRHSAAIYIKNYPARLYADLDRLRYSLILNLEDN